MKKENRFVYFAFAVVVCVAVFAVRNISYPQQIVEVCHHIADYVVKLFGIFNFSNTAYHMYNVYKTIVIFAFMAVSVAMGCGVVKLFKMQAADGAAAVYCDIGEVIKHGLLGYATFWITVILLLESVVGIGVAIGAVIINIILNSIGSIFFNIALGSWLQKIYNGNDRNLVLNYIIGILVIIMCCCIYGFAAPMFIFILPVLNGGAFLWVVRNFIIKKHYDLALVGFNKDAFDRKKIRKIITRDISDEA